ncbi:MAG: hypothetical protein HZC52_07385 [Planctomycetes bacterium]|nr:hypothetical protein [Planctomycetota bacterium]
MITIDHARKRVAAALEEIDRLKQSEFPYIHPCNALELLAERFKQQQSMLEKLLPDASPEVTKNACSASLYELYVYVPILGFILRSTNVRNAFEAYAPLMRLARSFLGDDTKLIMSSEWEFSPFVYRAIEGLKDFVLIGLPAPESANPLLIPLAGHELGHSVWVKNKCSEIFDYRIEDGVLKELKDNKWKEYSSLYPHYRKEDLTNLLAINTWRPAYTYAKFQAEEIFCDFFGLRLFAESYLHAFTYLLSPGLTGPRSVRYPNMIRRVSHIMDAANEMKITVPPGFESGFVTGTEPEDPLSKLLVSIADTISASLTPDLKKLVKEYASATAITLRDHEKVVNICADFKDRIAPTSESQSLTDLSNAGWICMLDPDLWKKVPQIKPEERDRVLKDLMLKSMEVSEFYERLRKSL